MPYRRILADNLIRFRKLEKITQAEISLRSAVSIDTISLIERESTNVTLDVLERLASYTGLTIPQLFTENFVNYTLLHIGEKRNAENRRNN